MRLKKRSTTLGAVHAAIEMLRSTIQTWLDHYLGRSSTSRLHECCSVVSLVRNNALEVCERAKVDHLTTLERDVSAIRSAVSALSCTSRQGSASHRLQTPEIVASLLRQLCGELMSSVGRRADTAFFQRSVRAGISTSIRLSFLHAQHLP